MSLTLAIPHAGASIARTGPYLQRSGMIASKLFEPKRYIEIKTDALGRPQPGIERKLVDIVKKRGLEERSILTCFAPEVLETVRDLWPRGRILASFDRRSAEMLGGVEPGLDRFLTIPGCLIAVEKSLLSLTLLLCLERVGSERLAAWVPNEPDDIAYWMAQPIRAITTDRPDIAIARRREVAA